MKYIDSEKLVAEIERMREINRKAFIAEHIRADIFHGRVQAINHLFEFITSLQQEQPEVENLKNKAELIANEIMMGVQANKYHTCIYDKASNDFNHSHLMRAALKGIELGLNARKEE